MSEYQTIKLVLNYNEDRILGIRVLQIIRKLNTRRLIIRVGNYSGTTVLTRKPSSRTSTRNSISTRAMRYCLDKNKQLDTIKYLNDKKYLNINYLSSLSQ